MDKPKLEYNKNITEFFNIKDLMQNAYDKYPDNVAFIIKNPDKTYKEITYKMLEEIVKGFGQGMIDKGYKGKRIAIIGKNRYEWMVAYIGTINGVGISVPLDKGLTEAEIETSLIKSKADAMKQKFDMKYLKEALKNKGETTGDMQGKLDGKYGDGQRFTFMQRLAFLIFGGRKAA